MIGIKKQVWKKVEEQVRDQIYKQVWRQVRDQAPCLYTKCWFCWKRPLKGGGSIFAGMVLNQQTGGGRNGKVFLPLFKALLIISFTSLLRGKSGFLTTYLLNSSRTNLILSFAFKKSLATWWVKTFSPKIAVIFFEPATFTSFPLFRLFIASNLKDISFIYLTQKKSIPK